MEKETTLNNSKTEFPETVDQKVNINWGLKSIEFVNGKINKFETEFFTDFKGSAETGHTIKIVEQGENGVKVERVYTHTALTSFYDVATGVFYIIGKNYVTFFTVSPPQKPSRKQKQKPKPAAPMKMQQKYVPIKLYNGIAIANVIYY